MAVLMCWLANERRVRCIINSRQAKIAVLRVQMTAEEIVPHPRKRKRLRLAANTDEANERDETVAGHRRDADLVAQRREFVEIVSMTWAKE